MRVVHVPFTFYPDPVGGTEVYVAELARGLRAHGIESVIAAPVSSGVGRAYEYDGTPVHRFAVDEHARVEDVYGEGDHAAATALDRILERVAADVLHLHAFTRAASVRAARLAHRRGVAVVFTYHTPTASCVRGTLMRDGRVPCDGTLDAQRCTACLLESRGASILTRAALSRVPAAIATAVASSGATGRWATAVRGRELTTARHDAFRALLLESDAIVAVSEWVRSLLIAAGAPPARLVLSRQGTPIASSERERPPFRRPRTSYDPLRLAFVGRLHPTKGVHVVLSALATRRDLGVTLDIYGVAQGADGARYAEHVRALARHDPRVRFRDPLVPSRVVETLAAYDATVVPSQWLETGPLTVLESFAAGVPVVGSNLGGIAELVAHDRDGWLVPHANVAAWVTALERLATEPGLIDRLRDGVRRPRSTADVAADMASVYERVAPRRTDARPLNAAGAGAA